MLGSSVIRDDGICGTIVAGEETGRIVVEFYDGSRIVVSPASLSSQTDGSYGLSRDAPNMSVSEFGSGKTVIPVIAEEFTAETHRVARGDVRINKRIDTREETVDTPVVSERVIVEHVPINKFVEDKAPETRYEDGVLIIPVIEEVLVTKKRLLVREEVRISRRRTTTNTPRKVVLRREVVDIEREQSEGAEPPLEAEDFCVRKEKSR